jgi:hypothetical protein
MTFNIRNQLKTVLAHSDHQLCFRQFLLHTHSSSPKGEGRDWNIGVF